jgi:ankyrin repeat protein
LSLGYASWPRLKHDLVFRSAVAALDVGDLRGLGALLRQHRPLVRYRQRVGEWYEEGYFAGATLLHHVAGNPIRCPLPPNILDVTRLLLQQGADPNAATLGGATTTELLLTSMQASEAGVAVALIDLLLAAGARDELRDSDVLTAPLLNAAPATAAMLAARGAAMDVRHAAGLGLLDQLGALLTSESDPLRRDEALLFACIRGQEEAARLLLRHGARGDVLVQPWGITPRTALHEAATRGHLGLVQLLLEHGAEVRVVEPHFGGTPADWARHGGHADIAAMLTQHGAEV